MVKIAIIIGFLFVVAPIISFANDSDRIELLEKEIRDLKIRIAKLEPQSISLGSQQGAAASSESGMSLENWRRLTKNMSPGTVRKILGEPIRINAGPVTTWRYRNGGEVGFIDDKIFAWREPEEQD